MFTIYLDDQCLYYPGDDVAAVSSAKIYEQIGDSGYINITVPKSNPLWNSFKERNSIITVFDNDEEIFCGEVREIGKNISLERPVYAVGEMSYLSDSIQPQREFRGTPLDFFNLLINCHNEQVEDKKRFTVGIVTVTDPNDNLYRMTNYENTLDALREKLCDPLNGYLRVRKVDGVRYIDLIPIEDYGRINNQPIKFGKNLLDYTDSITSDSIVTAVVPLGAKLEQSEIEGLDSYTNIKSVNDGLDYLIDEDAKNEFGTVKRTVHFDDVSEPQILKEKGDLWLKENKFSEMTITVNAVDLSSINLNIDNYKKGDSVRVTAKPFGLDTRYYITDKETDLLIFSNNKITIGNSLKLSYTKQSSKTSNEIRDLIPEEQSILDAAKQNATNLITMASEGYIFTVFDEEGNPKEILIMNTKHKETATKMWRWNINGLGYSNDGGKTFGLAMTMDGAIVADYIITGILQGITIKGNTVIGGTMVGTDISGGTVKINRGNSLASIIVYANNNKVNKMYGWKSIIAGDGTFTSIGNGVIEVGTYTGNAIEETSITYTPNIYMFSNGNFTAKGTKSRAVDTENYDTKLLYCLETPSPLFEDVGEGIIDNSGKCFVFIDEIFAETIDTDCQYQVFLQKYGPGDCYVSQRTNSYFIVEGSKGLSFGWTLKAVQNKYDTMRLETFDSSYREEDEALSYMSETEFYLNNLLYNVESEDYT